MFIVNLVHIAFCCIRFNFFHAVSSDWLIRASGELSGLAEWDAKPEHSQSVNCGRCCFAGCLL